MDTELIPLIDQILTWRNHRRTREALIRAKEQIEQNQHLLGRAYELVVGAQIRETGRERRRDLWDLRCLLEAALASPKPPNRASPIADSPTPDVVCEHGTAMDVHCCNCHSGFIFDKDHECPSVGADRRDVTEP